MRFERETERQRVRERESEGGCLQYTRKLGTETNLRYVVTFIDIELNMILILIYLRNKIYADIIRTGLDENFADD